MDKKIFYQYYKEYYKNALGLKDWQMRIENRFHENEIIQSLIESKLSLLNTIVSPHAKVLIVGGGTGAELIAFHTLGYEAWMIEPDPTAWRLARQKAADKGIHPRYVVQGIAEDLSFENQSFDFIWSFTVLEHVQCYKRAIEEISRVLKTNCFAFLQFQDYRCIYEAHYKLYLPLFLPKIVNAIILILRKRNPLFYMRHTNNITAGKFLRIVRNLPITAFYIHNQWDFDWKKNRTWKMNIAYYMKNLLGIEYSPSFFLKKNEV